MSSKGLVDLLVVGFGEDERKRVAGDGRKREAIDYDGVRCPDDSPSGSWTETGGRGGTTQTASRAPAPSLLQL